MSRPGVAELLAALNGALAGRRWYVFGAQAAVTYGRPRLTADVDVTVEPVDDLPALLADLKRADIALRLPGFDRVVDQARVLPLVHGRLYLVAKKSIKGVRAHGNYAAALYKGLDIQP